MDKEEKNLKKIQKECPICHTLFDKPNFFTPSRWDEKVHCSKSSCLGRIEVHHILGWAEFPELRYEINNGITLCKYHHPHKKSEESLLVPTFLELIKTNKTYDR